MDKFSAWLMDNAYTATGEVFDIGNSTRTAIANYRQGIEPLKCGGTSERENGNGSLMRILSLAYYLRERWDDTMEVRMELVHNVSALTHRHPISLIGCGIYINIALRLLGDDADLYMVLKAVNLGDDTDTVGAVAGGLAGIYYGADKIPEMLSKGCSISKCMEVTGIAWKDMQEFYDRLGKREIEHLCVRVPQSED